MAAPKITLPKPGEDPTIREAMGKLGELNDKLTAERLERDRITAAIAAAHDFGHGDIVALALDPGAANVHTHLQQRTDIDSRISLLTNAMQAQQGRIDKIARDRETR